MGEAESAFGSNGFQMMGIMNALKTGDVHLDMFIAMCVPFVLKILFGWVGKLEDIQNWPIWKRRSEEAPIEMYHRYISHSIAFNPWGEICSEDEDTQNAVLLKAIKLYLHSVVRLKLNSAHLDLTGLPDSADSDSDFNDDDEYGSRRTLVGTMSRYKIIDRILINEWHDLGEFGEPASPVSLRLENESEEQEGETGAEKKTAKVTTFHFMSPGEGAINAFIDKSYAWYLGELRKAEDHARYFYEAKIPEFTVGGGTSNATFKRYRLSDEKTFDGLYFREKESLLSLIDHFNAKTGKYAIKGYPHKLGVLLHGHPGTGKTSLIKALANYTGRSIVNVPLSSVSTNAQLMSIFFDRKYRVEGSWVPVNLGFKDVIFVMEDVDAASRIVKRRDGKKPSEVAEPEKIDLPVPKSLWRMFFESTHSDCKELVRALMEKSERLKCEAEAMRPEVMQTVARRLARMPALGLLGDGGDDPTLVQVCEHAMDSANKQKQRQGKLDEILASYAKEIKELLQSATEVDERFVSELLGETDSLQTTMPSTLTLRSNDPTADMSASTSSLESLDWMVAPERPSPPGEKEAAKQPAAKPGKGPKLSDFGPSLFRGIPDQLSLSGLLNVLDGVVDTPGRIIIMTTNHPEMLDPALIRPGRVDKKLMLGYMSAPDVASMLQHYFQVKFNESELKEIDSIVEGDDNPKNRLNMTPAQVEQLAAEHDTVEDILAALKNMAVVVRPRKLVKRVHSPPAAR